MEAESCLTTALQERDPYIKGFWYAKFLQKFSGTSSLGSISERTIIGQKTVQQHVSAAYACLAMQQTSLSPNVQALITSSIPLALSPATCAIDLLQSDMTLNWQGVEIILSISPKTDDLSVAARQIGAIAKQVYSLATEPGAGRLGEMEQYFCQWFEWTHSPSLFCECLHLLRSQFSLRCHLSLLLSSSGLERSLGDLYLHLSKVSQCPNMLKDLLATREIEELFGPIPMLCLRALIGPPSGLNLRNILWHGFAAPEEVPIQFAFLLLVIASSLGKIVQNTISSIPHRPFHTFPQTGILSHIFPEYGTEEMAMIEELFDTSFFILPSMRPIWLAALSCFKEGRYGWFVCLVLPQLEHSLRRVFACCNHCPDRMLTAESASFYTTLDEILGPVLQDGLTPNSLLQEIGVHKVEILLDIFVYLAGPRLRDKISHHEVDIKSFPSEVANLLLAMCVIFASQYQVSAQPGRMGDCVTRTVAAANSYTSLFHPLSLLRQELEELLSILGSWTDLVRCSSPKSNHATLAVSTQSLLDLSLSLGPLIQSLALSSPEVEQALLSAATCIDFSTQPVSLAMKEVWEKPVIMLYLPQNSMQTTGLLRRSVQHMTTSMVQIQQTALERTELLNKQQLHSRQRANLERLLARVGSYWSTTLLLVMATIVVVHHLPVKPDQQSHLFRFLRKMLQFTENFVSQTSPSRNRWNEAESLCYLFAELCRTCPIVTGSRPHPPMPMTNE